METLKPYEAVIEPDRRNLSCVVVDAHGNQRPLDLKFCHEVVAGISLNSKVPLSVRDHFAQAQNLAVYSWFHYQFHVTAEFMSIVTIEFALREKLQAKPSATFKNLIKRAVRENLICDEGFSVAAGKPNGGRRYVDTLIDVLPSLRNDYAHGTQMLHSGSFSSIRTAADFINQLFKLEDC